VPLGATLLDSLEVSEETGGGRRVRLPVPRPDLYDVWVYPTGPHGRPVAPDLLRQSVAVTVSGSESDPDLGIDLGFPPDEAGPFASTPSPFPAGPRIGWWWAHSRIRKESERNTVRPWTVSSHLKRTLTQPGPISFLVVWWWGGVGQ